MGTFDNFRNAFVAVNAPTARAGELKSAMYQQGGNLFNEYDAYLISQGYKRGTREYWNAFQPLAFGSGNEFLMEKPGMDLMDKMYTPPADPMLTNDYKNFLLEQKAGYGGTFVDYQQMDATRRTPSTTVHAGVTMPAGYYTPEETQNLVYTGKDGKNVAGARYTGINKEQVARDIEAGNVTSIDPAQKGKAQALANAKFLSQSLRSQFDELMQRRPANTAGYEGAAKQYVNDIWQSATGSDGGRIKAYKSAVEGYSTQIAKSLGEVGSMSDSDREFAKGLVGGIANFDPRKNDTYQSATRKFDQLDAIIALSQNTMLGADIPQSVSYEKVPTMDGSRVTKRVVRYQDRDGKVKVYVDPSPMNNFD